MKHFLSIFFAAVCFPFLVVAHIGSPNIIFEGQAGAYPVRVVVSPPEVVPGLAEISVRVLAGNVERVTALPAHGSTGLAGAPPPDEAKPVRGATNLYSAELWFMVSGSYSVHVDIFGDQGKGAVVVPVTSVATRPVEMPRYMQIILLALGALLYLKVVTIIGTAARESVLEPGAVPTRRQIWRGRITMVVFAALFAGVIYGGKMWWDAVDRDYRSNRLYRPIPLDTAVEIRDDLHVLKLNLLGDDGERRYRWTPIVPDHGKLMHLFMVREPELSAFAHLHPLQHGSNQFEVLLPPLPQGRYQLYADVTHESGSSQTLTAMVEVPNIKGNFPMAVPVAVNGNDPICAAPVSSMLVTNGSLAFDPDDSWHLSMEGAPAVNTTTNSRLGNGYSLVWKNDGALREGEEASLRFELRGPDGQPAPLQHYVGMLGHAAVRRKDGSVFAHLHPVGTFSMAAQEVMARREQRFNGSITVTNGAYAAHSAGITPPTGVVTFPYQFPRAGAYRLWVQVRSEGRVLTGVFDTEVQPAL